MNTSQNNFTQWKKPERKEHILYDSIIHSSDIGYLQMGLEGSMDWKEIKPVHPKADQSWWS